MLFWAMTPCELTDRHRCSIFRAKDKDNMFLQNAGIYVSPQGITTQKNDTDTTRTISSKDLLLPVQQNCLTASASDKTTATIAFQCSWVLFLSYCTMLYLSTAETAVGTSQSFVHHNSKFCLLDVSLCHPWTVSINSN
jgi:hypothetical protein